MRRHREVKLAITGINQPGYEEWIVLELFCVWLPQDKVRLLGVQNYIPRKQGVQNYVPRKQVM